MAMALVRKFTTSLLLRTNSIVTSSSTVNASQLKCFRNWKPTLQISSRLLSSEPAPSVGEENIIKILRTRFPTATDVRVSDMSGGCGEMYEVHVQSDEFAGLRTVRQHKLVTDALKKEVEKMHGIRIFTST